MQWEKVLTDGLGDPKINRIYFTPFPRKASVVPAARWELYISAYGLWSPRGMFFRVRPVHSAETNPWPLDREDVYSQIQPLSWMPYDVGPSIPLDPQCIGPMTSVSKAVAVTLPSGDVTWLHYYDLYVCARSPIGLGEATVVYQGSPSFIAGTPPMSWKVEAVLPGHITDPEIIGFKEHIFVSLGQATIGTNASGVWDIRGQEISASNSENESISSFYNSSDMLYAGTFAVQRQNKGAEIWSTKDGLTWDLERSFPDKADRGIVSMTEFRGNLYAGTDNHSGTHIWRRDNAAQWTDVSPASWASGLNVPEKTSVLRSYGDTLYAAGGGPQPFILTSKDGVNWDFDYTIQDADSNNYLIMDLNWFPDKISLEHGSVIFYRPAALFAGVGNPTTGCQLWRAPTAS